MSKIDNYIKSVERQDKEYQYDITQEIVNGEYWLREPILWFDEFD